MAARYYLGLTPCNDKACSKAKFFASLAPQRPAMVNCEEFNVPNTTKQIECAVPHGCCPENISANSMP